MPQGFCTRALPVFCSMVRAASGESPSDKGRAGMMTFLTPAWCRAFSMLWRRRGARAFPCSSWRVASRGTSASSGPNALTRAASHRPTRLAGDLEIIEIQVFFFIFKYQGQWIHAAAIQYNAGLSFTSTLVQSQIGKETSQACSLTPPCSSH